MTAYSLNGPVAEGSMADAAPSREAFDALVLARYAELRRFGYHLTGSWPNADDLVQTGLARTWSRWNRLRDPVAAEAYVRRVMVNTSISWWRRRWNREDATAQLPEQAYLTDSTAAVDENLRLQKALGRLAPRMRAVIVLRYAEDRTEAEVAAIMGISVGAVKSAAARGLARLRELDEFAQDRADRVTWTERAEARIAAPAPRHVDQGPA